MTKKAKSARTMDIQLLTRVEDDGSPFGVEYSTRRLTLEASGEVSCNDPMDSLWQELEAGIQGAESNPSESLKPSDGARFLDGIRAFFRYHYLSPLTPLIYDHRGASRPDDFRIVWNPREHLGVGHGYGFGYRAASRKTRGHSGFGPLIATLNGWGFMHEFDSPDEEVPEGRLGKPRIVIVDLLQRDSPHWVEMDLDADVVIRESKEFLRAFLRRFFERRTIGVFPETEGQLGRFVWRGGF